MEDIAGNAVAGLIAAVTATILLGVAKWIYGKRLQGLDVKQIREVLTEGRRKVLESKETSFPGIGTVSGDVLRCAQYNLMIEQLRLALDHRTSKLPYVKRKAIFDALNWYHTDGDSLYVIKTNDGKLVFSPDLPPGKWPTSDMKKNFAIDKFKRIESIKWLKLKPYTPMNG
ncbi:MAG: hypothetical protein F4049_05770 [Gemmatimonadetes bacterium]|nr:hypothetical protein [Gemmatimonadota bacterium]